MAVAAVVIWLCGMVVVTWPIYERIHAWGAPSMYGDPFLAVFAAMFWPAFAFIAAVYFASKALWITERDEAKL